MNYATKLTLPGARRQLEELQRRDFALSHAAGALEFDAMTLAPPGNRAARSHTLAVLGQTSLELVSSAEGIRLLDFLTENASELTDSERRAVHLLNRSGEVLRHVNLEEYLAFRKLANETASVWAAAKERSDFKLLEPWLGRLFAAERRIANQVLPDRPAEDFWLDFNEEGLTTERCEACFADIEAAAGAVMDRAAGMEPAERRIDGIRVPPLRQQRVARAVMSALGVDANRSRLAVADHTFTVAFSRYDVRVCTNYDPEDFTASLYGVMHECGHALYELGVDELLQFTRLGLGVSMAVHESQALLFENHIGRSLEWTRYIWPLLTENIPELGGLSPEEYWRDINAPRRTPLRAEADEFSYTRHIRLRWEIERRLLDGGLAIEDAPAAWNELARGYLGCEVKSDAEGILQDAHWASGQVGYFPAYAVGSIAAAQLVDSMRRETGGGLSPSGALAWLGGKLWSHGAFYPPDELMRRAMGGRLDAAYYAKYLSDKLSGVCGVK